jgi:hypothetical protein
MPALKLNERRKFNINNKADVEIYKHFLVHSNWKVTGSCPFQLEYPWNSVPDMIKDKLVRKFLKV